MSSTEDRALAILKAEPWKPTKPEIVRGTVVGFNTYTHPEFGTSPVVYVETAPDTFVAIYCLHQVMTDAFAEIKPQIGTAVTVAYLGKVKSNKRKDSKTGEATEYHSYQVSEGLEISGPSEESPF